MKIKVNIIKFCVGIISAFIGMCVPVVYFVVPGVTAILATPWFLLFYIITLPLAFIWYSIVPKAWKEMKEDLIEDLIDMLGENAEDKQ
jgi:membrane protein implicated in regulation of membrane protease activity